MTAPRPDIDPAFGAALDHYDVPAATPDFADRIVAAALDAPAAVAGAAPRRRDRRGPWTRRAIAGGIALALGTTAVAAALLDRAGIHLPQVVAMLAPAAPPAPKTAPRHPSHVRHGAAKPAAATDIAESAPAAPEPLAAAPPPMLALIRARLAALPPEQRRAVARRIVRRVVIARAIERRRVASGQPALVAGRPAPFADRPLLRAALLRRLAAARERRAARSETAVPGVAASMTAPAPQPGRSALAPPEIASPEIAPAETLRSPDIPDPSSAAPSGGGATPAPVTRAERVRRLIEVRRMRALRGELRRQRFR